MLATVFSILAEILSCGPFFFFCYYYFAGEIDSGVIALCKFRLVNRMGR